jgi:hypothetical protein
MTYPEVVGAVFLIAFAIFFFFVAALALTEGVSADGWKGLFIGCFALLGLASCLYFLQGVLS